MTSATRAWITSLVTLGAVVLVTTVALLTGQLQGDDMWTILLSIGGALGLRSADHARTGG
jgi:Flp pilus assembly pilin Flp